MKHIQCVDRKQMVLFPKAIDDYIPARRQAGLPDSRICQQANRCSFLFYHCSYPVSVFSPFR